MKAVIVAAQLAAMTEISLDHVSTDASSLGWPAGFWPMSFDAPDIGNRQPFIAMRRLDDGGMEYEQGHGTFKITVFND